MKRQLIIILTLLVTGLMGAALADTIQTVHYYTNQDLADHPGFAIILKGTPQKISVFAKWLDQIATIHKGLDTLEQIAGSGHQLIIRHAPHALLSAGRTMAPMSPGLINGKGESVEIIFNAEIPDQGSHMVYNSQRHLIEYTAIQNLYHELAHAMHMMKGTWRYFKSEQQAIEEENDFRKDLALMQGKEPALRFGKRGVLIGDVDHTIAISEMFGPAISKSQKPKNTPKTFFSTGVSPRNRGWH